MTALTPAERRAIRRALYDWLAIYAHGVRPDGYADAESAVKKLEQED